MPAYYAKIVLLYCFLLSLSLTIKASNNSSGNDFKQTPIFNNTLQPQAEIQLPSKVIQLIGQLQQATTENKKVTAAILTLTLGMLGVHRIYLGTAPYIPAVYLFTFGGGFFILPLIDLVMILTTNDISKFENNDHLLMWAN